MRTTVTIEEALVRELLLYSNAKTKTSAVVQAVKEQIRRAKLQYLASQLGKIEFDETVIEKGNKDDLHRAQWLSEIGAVSESN